MSSDPESSILALSSAAKRRRVSMDADGRRFANDLAQLVANVQEDLAEERATCTPLLRSVFDIRKRVDNNLLSLLQGIQLLPTINGPARAPDEDVTVWSNEEAESPSVEELQAELNALRANRDTELAELREQLEREQQRGDRLVQVLHMERDQPKDRHQVVVPEQREKKELLARLSEQDEAMKEICALLEQREAERERTWSNGQSQFAKLNAVLDEMKKHHKKVPVELDKERKLRQEVQGRLQGSRSGTQEVPGVGNSKGTVSRWTRSTEHAVGDEGPMVAGDLAHEEIGEEEDDSVETAPPVRRTRSSQRDDDDEEMPDEEGNEISPEGSALGPDFGIIVEKLKSYKEEHGHMFVPDGHRLGTLVRSLRRRRKGQRKMGPPLMPAQIAALDAIGFEWNGKTKYVSWVERIEALKAYKEEHGNLLVPFSYVGQRKLGQFASNMRSRYRRGAQLTEEEIAELNSIGFVWEP